MSNPLQDVKQLLASAEGPSRKALLGQLHEIIISIETPEETATRISLYPLQTSAARIGQDLKIFQTLANSGPKSLQELQDITNAHPITLGRLLRYMASVGLIREAAINRFEANKKCQNLAMPEAITILTHFFENCCPLFQEMPAFLRNNNYQDVTDGKATVFQPAYKTDLDTYTWFSHNPEHRSALIKYMAMEQTVRGRWLDEYPIERDTQGWDPKLPVFVDIGGNIGHYCAQFKERFPEVPGRVVLQDLPDTLAHAMPTPGVEAVAHDFFTPQPLKNAKFYHLGWVLHNWNDEKSKQILRQIRSAMTAHSVILINDMILPEAGVPAFPASLDMVMLGACGSRERTMKEWNEIFGDVGLVVKERIMYNRELCHGILGIALA
ncbi:S-adenosyl-L-methionine-dependent methyltransferase [Pseudomassariella vexata]|uniref:S-adenosyl-L-methionine-dependent methyltransferase n=1 Tax=Pseudomassariella vexata TaxID=1141098 RepID=A0A1Y2DBH0_9PEZI|nr:S-adenosyl-L-methionine-dependent methyltransferase [Pseudomassariella vexata]ORY56608.1 S-adenosyl-L-methionine-dependent methyltransferase [Pseudomassariella vexata]